MFYHSRLLPPEPRLWEMLVLVWGEISVWPNLLVDDLWPSAQRELDFDSYGTRMGSSPVFQSSTLF